MADKYLSNQHLTSIKSCQRQLKIDTERGGAERQSAKRGGCRQSNAGRREHAGVRGVAVA